MRVDGDCEDWMGCEKTRSGRVECRIVVHGTVSQPAHEYECLHAKSILGTIGWVSIFVSLSCERRTYLVSERVLRCRGFIFCRELQLSSLNERFCSCCRFRRRLHGGIFQRLS
jgi:hypothetical protein